MALMEMQDLADDSWVDMMRCEETRHHLGHRLLDSLHHTKDWPAELLRAYRYTPRKKSRVYDALVFWRRLSKLLQFAYVSIVVACGLTPATVAGLTGDTAYLVYALAILLVPPLWLAEKYCWRRGYRATHTRRENGIRLTKYPRYVEEMVNA